MAFRDINFTSTGKPVIKIAEIKNGITEQTKFTDAEYESCYYITAGDMLFSWSGQPETSIDVFWWRGQDGWLNQHTFKVIPDKSQCLPEFFYYLLKYLRPNFIAIAKNKQTTGLGHVTKTDLESMIVGVPLRPTQEAISRILRALDDKIELNRRMNETLEGIAQAIFKSWFVDAVENEVPNGWRVCSLPEAIEVNPPRSLNRGEVAPYLDMQNMPTRGHRPVEWFDRAFGSGMKFINGDTLLARITPCLENGKTSFVDFLREGQVGWGSTEYIVLRPKPPLPLEFGYYLARSEGLRAYAIQNMTGSSGRQRVPSDCFAEYEITVPPEPLAKKFGLIARGLVALIRANDEQSRTLAALRDTLLPKLISGQIRIVNIGNTIEKEA